MNGGVDCSLGGEESLEGTPQSLYLGPNGVQPPALFTDFRKGRSVW